jgi:tetratricopeptide (TPR) repeat protein
VRRIRALATNVALALAAPALTLVLLNTLLGAVGYGIPTAFFLRGGAPHQELRFANPDYALQFLPRWLSRGPQPIALAPKREDTVRVFVLGESAAAGDPEPAFGFSRALDVLLREYTTGKRVEVINTAITAMNSHVIRRIAAEVAEQSPDAFVVYMGNNEVVGPYGPRAVPEWIYGRGRALRALMAVRRTRLGQLVRSWTGEDAEPGRQWSGMEAFLDSQLRENDRRLQRMYGYFESNLRSVIRSARSAGAGVFLATVPINLRSCAPFASMHRRSFSADDGPAWTGGLEDGRAAQHAGDCRAALVAYERAAAIDDRYADLVFAMGQCAAAVGDQRQAAIRWGRARDLDSLRFRADGNLNAIVRQVATEMAAARVVLVDMEQAVVGASTRGVPGDDLFVDHVHLNLRGNVVAALTTFAALRDRLDGVRFLPLPGDVIELETLIRRRLVYDARSELDIASLMYRRKTRPPFVGQLDHDAEMATLRKQLIGLRAAARGVSWEDRESALRRALERRPDDGMLVARLSAHYAAGGQVERSLALLDERLKQAPYDGFLRGARLDALARAGRPAEAVALLTTPAGPPTMDRRQALAWVGSTLIAQGRRDLAAPVLQELLAADPTNVQALLNLGALAVQAGDADTATRHLTRALELNPDSSEAMVNLAGAHAMQGRRAEALRLYTEAVEADPNNYLAHAGLGMQQLRDGQLQEGITHLIRAVELEPEYVDGYRTIAAAYERLHESARAAEYLRLASAFQR